MLKLVCAVLLFSGVALAEPKSVDNRLGEISQAFGAHDYSSVLREARELHKDLLAQGKPDPMELGWARYYIFKSLFSLERNQEAYDLVRSTEKVPFAMPEKNFAYMYSVSAELAQRLKRPSKEIDDWGTKSCALRQKLGDAPGEMQCEQTVCALLQMNKDVTLITKHAVKLLALAEDQHATEEFFNGAGFFLDGTPSRAKADKPTLRALETKLALFVPKDAEEGRRRKELIKRLAALPAR